MRDQQDQQRKAHLLLYLCCLIQSSFVHIKSLFFFLLKTENKHPEERKKILFCFHRYIAALNIVKWKETVKKKGHENWTAQTVRGKRATTQPLSPWNLIDIMHLYNRERESPINFDRFFLFFSFDLYKMLLASRGIPGLRHCRKMRMNSTGIYLGSPRSQPTGALGADSIRLD